MAIKRRYQENKTAQTSHGRRAFIKKATAASLVYWQSTSALSNINIAGSNLVGSQTKPSAAKKLVWVVLRGALDPLHTIVPTFESSLKSLRPTLYNNFPSALLPLERGFALHPSLSQLHQWYQSNMLIPIVAVGSGYPSRSHFDGQDFLETGKGVIDHQSGWLARAIDLKHKQAIALSHSIPISLRSSQQVKTWYPSNLKDASEDLHQQLATLYEDNAWLTQRLREGLEVNEMAMADKQKKYKGKFIDLATACGHLLNNDDTDVAMLELGGWDTHNNQANRLTNKLKEFDQGLAALRATLADNWQDTVVVVATEFGRTVKENGTKGTDHGTASALFLAGGNINGGKVLGEWPSLSSDKLFQARDLMPTSDLFSWIATLLTQFWEIKPADMHNVFPIANIYPQTLINKGD